MIESKGHMSNTPIHTHVNTHTDIGDIFAYTSRPSPAKRFPAHPRPVPPLQEVRPLSPQGVVHSGSKLEARLN
ncbi:hypothetical protein E2C01_087780 [Portunus trituberculatus]|uniref:Uncharacterized protein n=1 Tax=Portunus trituberculatus TaxID=210409 RepID=A0A5B7JF00_PORTR|nr:hypothetical protein [Portunus trituberculatus]